MASHDSRSTRVAAAAVIASVLAGASLVAQPQTPTFRTGTQIVSLYATVMDAQNRLVPDLGQEEFEILDNEKPQPIVVFRDEVQPITVVLLLDTSGSMTGSI